jgi:protein-tyrosine phosphatase
MFKHILVVCTGNICRSPMAEELLRKAAPDRIVESAGIAAVIGWGAAPEAQQVMTAHGHDIGGHVARQITGKMLASSDLVLTMDSTHDRWIFERYPQHRGKVHKMLKWHGNQDVEDPYGQPLAEFERTYEELTVAVRDWMTRL